MMIYVYIYVLKYIQVVCNHVKKLSGVCKDVWYIVSLNKAQPPNTILGRSLYYRNPESWETLNHNP